MIGQDQIAVHISFPALLCKLSHILALTLAIYADLKAC